MSLSENLAKLNADIAELIADLAEVQADLDAIAAEIPRLQATPEGSALAADLKAINWQKAICTMVAVYQMVSAFVPNLPVIPTPAFCLAQPETD